MRVMRGGNSPLADCVSSIDASSSFKDITCSQTKAKSKPQLVCSTVPLHKFSRASAPKSERCFRSSRSWSSPLCSRLRRSAWGIFGGRPKGTNRRSGILLYSTRCCRCWFWSLPVGSSGSLVALLSSAAQSKLRQVANDQHHNTSPM